MNYKEMNEFTYLYNQYNLPGRGKLFDLIIKTAGIDSDSALYSAKNDCYRITGFENILFNEVECDEVTIENLSKFVYDIGAFDKVGSFQRKSTKDVLVLMNAAGLIRNYNYKDTDYGTWDQVVKRKTYNYEQREKAFKDLIKRTLEPDFNSCRVCFDNGSTYGHAIMVIKDEITKKVSVSDNSTRSRKWPTNAFELYINKKNIKWFTEVTRA